MQEWSLPNLMKAPELEVEENGREESDEGEGDDGGPKESLRRKPYGKAIAPIPMSLANVPLKQRCSSSQSARKLWQSHFRAKDRRALRIVTSNVNLQTKFGSEFFARQLPYTWIRVCFDRVELQTVKTATDKDGPKLGLLGPVVKANRPHVVGLRRSGPVVRINRPFNV